MGKKILVVIGASYVSGLEVVTLHLMKGLKERGYDVRCFVNGWNDGQFKSLLEGAEIPYAEAKLGWLYITKPLWTLDTLLHLPGAFLKGRRFIKTFAPDILHFCGYSSVVMLGPLLKNKACVYNLQEPHEPSRKHLAIYRILNRRIAAFTAVSRHIGKVLLQLEIPIRKIGLIYNGVPAIQDAAVKEPGEKMIFGIIGQVASWKGHGNLVDAVVLLRDASCPVFEVKIFGNKDNPYARELKKKIADRGVDAWFSWEGFVRDQDSIYRQVDAVVVPSLSEEPCSLTVLESMMRKKGIIVSDRGGNPELIDHGVTGLVFPAEDPGELARHMRSFLLDRGMAVSLGERAGQKAAGSFTDTRMTDEYIRLYEAILSRRTIPQMMQQHD